VEENCPVFKLVGSVLLKQERDEAVSNVTKRVGFIRNELEKIERQLKEGRVQFDAKQNELVAIQNSFTK
jgi:prefoldin beta subunit